MNECYILMRYYNFIHIQEYKCICCYVHSVELPAKGLFYSETISDEIFYN